MISHIDDEQAGAMLDPLDAPLSVFLNAKRQDPVEDKTTLRELLDDIRGDQFKEDVEAIRRHLEDYENDQADERKKTKLPCVMLSGWAVTRRERAAAADRAVNHSGWLQGDFDYKDNHTVALADLVERLKASPYVQAVFRTPSGVGAKAVIRIPADVAQHRAAFEAAAEHFAAAGLKLDPSTKDPGRLCFVSWDPEAWMRDGLAEVIEPKAPVSLSQRAAGRSSGGGFETLDTTSADIREMLGFIPPRPEYHDWLRIASAVWSVLDEASGTALLEEWSPEEKPGEYARKFKKRLKDVRCGTLVFYAEQHGFDAAAAASRKRWCGRLKFVREVAGEPAGEATDGSAEDPSADAGTEPASIDPERIFYDAPAGKYFLDTGTRFDAHAKPAPLLYGLGVYLTARFDTLTPKQVKETARETLDRRSITHAVQWSGAIAGHRRGYRTNAEGQPILITSEANLVEPADGPFPVIARILREAFPDPVPMQVFVGWLAGRVRSVRAGIHMPAPAVVLAAGVNRGKSLLAKEVIGQCLGGRTASPLKSWAGLTLWNDDLLKAELLLVDDEVATTDIRSRRNFGASLKTALFAPAVAINRRNNSSIHVRPVWSVVICCNDTPEALQIIPPLDADLADKVILLRPETITPPVDTSTPEGRAEFQAMIRAELPQFLSFLEGFTLPESLQDSRSGVKAYRDPQLLQNVGATSPEHQLEELLVATAKAGWMRNLSPTVSAADLQLHLLDPHSPVRDQAKALLSWPQACGAYLARLADNGSQVVTDGGKDGHRKIRLYDLHL